MNGHRLLDMNHSEVVKTLKELPKHFRLVCSRNLEHVPIQVIDTAQEKSAFAARVSMTTRSFHISSTNVVIFCPLILLIFLIICCSKKKHTLSAWKLRSWISFNFLRFQILTKYSKFLNSFRRSQMYV